MKSSPWRKSDLIVIPSLVLLSIVITVLSSNGEGSGRAVVIFQGKHIQEFDLNQHGKYSVQGLNGEMIIEINENGLHIQDSHCPHKFCIKQGYIIKSGQILICVPNGIAIRIEGGQKNDIDAVVG